MDINSFLGMPLVDSALILAISALFWYIIFKQSEAIKSRSQKLAVSSRQLKEVSKIIVFTSKT